MKKIIASLALAGTLLAGPPIAAQPKRRRLEQP